MHKDILVIDDNPDIRFLICNILKEQNFKVRSAANYDQAVVEINKKLPDLAVVDIKLDKEDKDGIDLLKLIVNKNKLTPVIMISGHATVQMAVESIRSTLRGNLAEQVEEIVDWELSEQVRLQKTEDFKAGIAASLAREIPKFKRN